jgi:hypothetical protein
VTVHPTILTHTKGSLMNKVKLDLGRLQVDSFDTAAVEEAERGTVHGHWSQPGTCDARAATCQYGGTCGPGCASRDPRFCTGTCV